jgi:hypothetical protein
MIGAIIENETANDKQKQHCGQDELPLYATARNGVQ